VKRPLSLAALQHRLNAAVAYIASFATAESSVRLRRYTSSLLATTCHHVPSEVAKLRCRKPALGLRRTVGSYDFRCDRSDRYLTKARLFAALLSDLISPKATERTKCLTPEFMSCLCNLSTQCPIPTPPKRLYTRSSCINVGSAPERSDVWSEDAYYLLAPPAELSPVAAASKVISSSPHHSCNRSCCLPSPLSPPRPFSRATSGDCQESTVPGSVICRSSTPPGGLRRRAQPVAPLQRLVTPSAAMVTCFQDQTSYNGVLSAPALSSASRRQRGRGSTKLITGGRAKSPSEGMVTRAKRQRLAKLVNLDGSIELMSSRTRSGLVKCVFSSDSLSRPNSSWFSVNIALK